MKWKQRLLSSLDDDSYLLSQSHMGYCHMWCCRSSLSDREERYIARQQNGRRSDEDGHPAWLQSNRSMLANFWGIYRYVGAAGFVTLVRHQIVEVINCDQAVQYCACTYICSAKAKTTNVTVLQISFTTNITGHLDQVATVRTLITFLYFFFK